MKKRPGRACMSIASYASDRGTSTEVHPLLADIETKVIRGEACEAAARRLYAVGFRPDVIVAHPGWGESLFLKTLWPHARLGIRRDRAGAAAQPAVHRGSAAAAAQ